MRSRQQARRQKRRTAARREHGTVLVTRMVNRRGTLTPPA
jgi:hypothetical protein